MNFQALFAGILIIPLLGCSTTTEVTRIEDSIEAQGLLQQAAQKQRLQQHQANEAYMERVPEWALTTRAPDQQGVYALGIADGSTVPLALKKARLQAEFGLAKAFAQEISGFERLVQEDNDNQAGLNKYIEVIDKLVSRVPVVGTQIIEQELISSPVTGRFTSFMLLRLPYDEINRVLRDQRNQSGDVKVQAYFDDLERRVDKRRAQRREEKQQDQHAVNDIAPTQEEADSQASPEPALNTTSVEQGTREAPNLVDKVLSAFRH